VRRAIAAFYNLGFRRRARYGFALAGRGARRPEGRGYSL